MRILCYGDSNTWGYVPNIYGYSKDAIMQQYRENECWWYPLTSDNEVFVDGLCGRCIAHENRWLADRNATTTLNNDLKNYPQLDLIIVQLGTNDCKLEYHDTAEQISSNMEILLQNIKKLTNAQIALISPTLIKENNPITQKYYIGAENKSKLLDHKYSDLSRKNGYTFISGIDLETGEDGEHLTKLGHKQLGDKILEKIKYYQNNSEMEN